MSQEQPSWPLYQRYIACYALWAGLSALTFWLLWQLRINLIDLMVLSSVDRWAFSAVHNWSMIALTILWLSFVVGLEHYLNKGIRQGKLLARATKVFGVVLVLLLLSYAFQYLAVS